MCVCVRERESKRNKSVTQPKPTPSSPEVGQLPSVCEQWPSAGELGDDVRV